MDVHCTTCGEPWDVYHLWHEAIFETGLSQEEAEAWHSLSLGLKKGGQVVAEETPEGILLRVGATFPVEIYTDKRLAEFRRNNEEALASYRLKK